MAGRLFMFIFLSDYFLCCAFSVCRDSARGIHTRWCCRKQNLCTIYMGERIVLQGWSIYKSLSSCFFEVLSTIGYLRGCAFIPFGYSQKIYEQRWRTCIQQSRSIAVSVLERRREETGWESPRIWRVFTQVYAIRVRQQCAMLMTCSTHELRHVLFLTTHFYEI